MQALSQNEIEKALATLPEWRFQGDALHRDFVCADFRQAMGLILAVAFEAEQRNHHPDVHNVYNRVSIALSTHDAGGKVTAKDVDLALAIEKAANQPR